MTADYRAQLLEKISTGDAKVAIIGLGYVGLPLAVVFAEAGFHVTGIDLSPERVALINAGQSYIADVPQSTIQRLRAENRLQATTNFDVLSEIDAISICVPTPQIGRAHV